MLISLEWFKIRFFLYASDNSTSWYTDSCNAQEVCMYLCCKWSTFRFADHSSGSSAFSKASPTKQLNLAKNLEQDAIQKHTMCFKLSFWRLILHASSIRWTSHPIYQHITDSRPLTEWQQHNNCSDNSY